MDISAIPRNFGFTALHTSRSNPDYCCSYCRCYCMAARCGRWHPSGGAANAEYSASTRHQVVRLNPQRRRSSRLWSRISWVSGLPAPSSAVWSYSTYAWHSSCQGHPDPCLRGPRRLSESNRMEETTRASSHYLASSSYQRLLPHSNRSFAAGDWPFKMEIARYGHFSYASLRHPKVSCQSLDGLMREVML